MEWLKDALIARRRRELEEQWRRVGRSLADLLRDEGALRTVPPEAAWHVINSLRAGLDGLERALRQARGASQGAQARRALGETAIAVGDVVELLERYGVPAAEKAYGLPPPQTRWTCRPASPEPGDAPGNPSGPSKGGDGR